LNESYPIDWMIALTRAILAGVAGSGEALKRKGSAFTLRKAFALSGL